MPILERESVPLFSQLEKFVVGPTNLSYVSTLVYISSRYIAQGVYARKDVQPFRKCYPLRIILVEC